MNLLHIFNSHLTQNITRISSNGKKIVTFSDIHADIHSLIICLRDCAQVINGTLSFEELENLLKSHIDVFIDYSGKVICKKQNGELFDSSLGFSWIKNCMKCVVIIGDFIDGKRVINDEICEHEYPQIEFKILAFINALIFQGGDIYKLLGNHELLNITNPEQMYLFENDKKNAYTKVNDRQEFRKDFFKIDTIGYNAIFYRKCYMLLQIDETIFVHGQLSGENYTYYEVLNCVLNYNVVNDIKRNINNEKIKNKITQMWYAFVSIIIYKSIYIKNLEKWLLLYQYLKTNISNTETMLCDDINQFICENIHNPDMQKNCDILRSQLSHYLSHIKFITKTLDVYHTKTELLQILKPEFTKLKQIIFSYLNNSEELWGRHYGFGNDDLLNNVVENDLTSYNIHNGGIIAQRIVIGHCTQNIFTASDKIKTSYHTVIHTDNDMIERLIPPSLSSAPYYTSKSDNLIFGITMSVPCDCKNKLHKLYKVDVGTSRCFDVFSNYQSLLTDIENLDFCENNNYITDLSLVIDNEELPFIINGDFNENDNSELLQIEYKSENYNNDTELLRIDCQDENDDYDVKLSISDDNYDEVTELQTIQNSYLNSSFSTELSKYFLIKKFLYEFISRSPQILEINNNDISIVRASLKNIVFNQPRHILNLLLQNKYIMETVQNGGF